MDIHLKYYFEWKLPINNEPFPIFYSCSGEIPKIKDSDIRQKIIVTYTLLQSAIMSLRMNNELLEHMQFAAESYRKSNGSRDKAILDASLHRLREYLAPLKKIYLDAIESSQDLVKTVQKIRQDETM